jgi:hypothetical protein
LIKKKPLPCGGKRLFLLALIYAAFLCGVVKTTTIRSTKITSEIFIVSALGTLK